MSNSEITIQYGQSSKKYNGDISNSEASSLLQKLNEEISERKKADNILNQQIASLNKVYYHPNTDESVTGIKDTSELSFVTTTDADGNKEVKLFLYDLPIVGTITTNPAKASTNKSETLRVLFEINPKYTEDPRKIKNASIEWFINENKQTTNNKSFSLDDVKYGDNKIIKAVLTDYRGRTSSAEFNTDDLYIIASSIYFAYIPTELSTYYISTKQEDNTYAWTKTSFEDFFNHYKEVHNNPETIHNTDISDFIDITTLSTKPTGENDFLITQESTGVSSVDNAITKFNETITSLSEKVGTYSNGSPKLQVGTTLSSTNFNVANGFIANTIERCQTEYIIIILPETVTSFDIYAGNDFGKTYGTPLTWQVNTLRKANQTPITGQNGIKYNAYFLNAGGATAAATYKIDNIK